MSDYKDKIAIVTGAASGIGRAVAQALANAGASVVLADINAALLAEAVNGIGGRATGATLDVRDAAAVKKLVDDTAARLGRLDYIFNNAGIAIMGEVIDMDLDDWTRIVDVNIRGVAHGVAAAYPLMIKQGSGHIVNTASVAGLIPSPGMTAYSMTKHAVVGLSRGLRGEAKYYGVKVSVVCPGFVDTPLKQNSKALVLDREGVLSDIPFTFYSADACALEILRGVSKNKQEIVITPHAKLFYRMQRWLPRLVESIAASQMTRMRARKFSAPRAS